jgi:hypothetical protein
LQGFEVIGAATRWWGKKRNPSTFVLMKFELGNARLRLDWENGKISWIEIQTTLNVHAAQTIIQPTSQTDYVGFNLGIEKTVRLKIKRSRENRAVGIRIDTGQIKGKEARRVSDPVN